MTEDRESSPPDPEPEESQVGCVAGILSGVIGNAIGTAALLVLHPDWLFGDGESILTIVAGLLPGWGIALGVAVLAGFVLVRLLSLITRGRRVRRTWQRFNVVLIFVVPAAMAAGTLWYVASVDR
jgi:hypothetical protein